MAQIKSGWNWPDVDRRLRLEKSDGPAHLAVMPHTKIATCTYCGTRAALVINQQRHELVCSSCGAPLHDLKMLKQGAADPERHAPPRKGKKGKTRHEGWHGAPHAPQERKGHPERRRKKKSRKGLARSIFEEAFDLIEDIFD
ncbi:hypothetical protein [Primorskyibacter sp. 2E233]|uniref:hypothetical protein n=1 Tax=Primorskyibacter sp. 2E233 TaxID=3413431 RepID=UPI003BF165C9